MEALFSEQSSHIVLVGYLRGVENFYVLVLHVVLS
jgi:hypothetical protein